jgi:23S rRNA (guanine745-N1)-methyltransferase
MRAEVVRHLRCPTCHGPLSLSGTPRGPLTCPHRHSFDQARQGYVQLSAGPLVHTGDSAEMIAARSAFLGAGHYAPITSALREIAVTGYPGGLVLDVGAGTGHHLAGVLSGLPDDAYGLATDASKPAVRAAARAHPRADAIVCDAWLPLPLIDHSVGVALNVFAPRPGAEFARVLRPDGVLLVVTPTDEHLSELIEPLDLLRVDPTKADRIAGALDTVFIRRDTNAIRTVMTLDHEDIATLVGMGPSAWHTDAAAMTAKIANLPHQAQVTLSVTTSTYRPR